MENEVVGQDRWAYIWKTLWHGFKAQSRGSKATLGEVVPGPKALLPLPQRRDSLLLAFPVLLIPEALSFYFVSKIKWNPTIGGRLPDCLLFGVKGLASRKGGGAGAGHRASRSRCHGGHNCFPGAPSCPAQRHFEHLPCFLLSPTLVSLNLPALLTKRLPGQAPHRLPDKTNPDSSPKRPTPQQHQAQASARAGRIAAWLLHLKPAR